MGKKWSKTTKKSALMVHICKIILSADVLFIFFKIYIFWVVREVNRPKMVQNDKKFCLSCFISQELYIIWLSFVVHMCKMMISPGFLFIFFKIFIFRVYSPESKQTKNGWKWQKIQSIMFHISGTIQHMIFIYGTHV